MQETQQEAKPEKVRKVPPKGTPEYREYTKQAKRRSREKEKQEREAAQIPTMDDYLDSFRSTADFIRMRTWIKQTSAKIEGELGRKIKIQTLEEAVGFTLEVAYGFEHGMTKKVLEYGLMVGCLFPDAIGWTIVPAAHEHGLEKSPTFKSIYRPLLTLLDEKYGNNNDKHSRAIKAELAAHIKCEFLSAS
jgi:hypothetical protein